MRTLINILLLIIAVVTLPIALFFGFFGLLYQLISRGIVGLWIKFGYICYGTAILIDRWDNMMMGWILNITMIKKGGHMFGDYNETISSAIGKNLLINKLTLFGRLINKLLEKIDENHAIESIDKKVVASVSDDLFKRQDVGIAKYGTTVDRQDLTREQWLQHMYEELLDGAVYAKKLLKTKI